VDSYGNKLSGPYAGGVGDFLVSDFQNGGIFEFATESIVTDFFPELGPLFLMQAFQINLDSVPTGSGVIVQLPDVSSIDPVPEPSAFVIFAGLGVMGLVGYVWRRKTKGLHHRYLPNKQFFGRTV
jgi:hypothetical protein